MIYVKRRVNEESKHHLLHKAKKMAKFTKELVDMLEDCLEEDEEYDDEDDDEDENVRYRSQRSMNEGNVRMRRGR